MFKIFQKSKDSGARLGILKTPHGDIQTPAYVIVGTEGAVRCLDSEDIRLAKTQIIIANTYHLWRQFEDRLSDFPGLHRWMGWNGPLMTDSGGFQVFSLGFSREHGVGKIASMFPQEKISAGQLEDRPEENLVRITEAGVYFKDPSIIRQAHDGERGRTINSGQDAGEELYLDAETSIRIQEQLGADIILAFDECTSPFHDYEYTKRAMERTHRWAERCLEAKAGKDQLVFGIIQGGAFRDLREKSAKFIGSLPFDGIAIGGSLGKSRQEMFEILKWIIPLLPEDKPRHLLGIGRPEDIFEIVGLGIDTFDCVVPTREARHGAIWTRSGRIDIRKGKYQNDPSRLDENCFCAACDSGLTRAELYKLFKTKNFEAGHLATIHNVYFFNDLMEQIRQAVAGGYFEEFKKSYLLKSA